MNTLAAAQLALASKPITIPNHMARGG
jgi:hypothetical protein